MAERPPLAGRRVVEVLATSAGGVGTHVRALLPALREAGADVGVCGAPATEELFGFTAAGADFTPVGISSGLAPVADARAVAAAAPRARRRRPGARPRAARRPGRGRRAARPGGRAPPLVLTLHNALQEGGGRLRGCAAGPGAG